MSSMDEFFKQDRLNVGSKGLVFIGDKVLVYRRDNKTDKYPLCLDLPGGGPEGVETPFETFQREVMEEFGLAIVASDILYVRRYPSSLDKGRSTYYPVVKLPADAAKQIRFGDEGAEYLLMTFDEYIRRSDAVPIFQQRALDYMNAL